MLSLFKRDLKTKLSKQYDHKLEQAMMAQRNGDIRGYARLTAEAENIAQQLQVIKQNRK